MQSDDEDRTLATMRQAWAPGWRIWRSKRSDNGEPSAWWASRMEPDAGADPTVACDTAAELGEELRRQRAIAEAAEPAE